MAGTNETSGRAGTTGAPGQAGASGTTAKARTTREVVDAYMSALANGAIEEAVGLFAETVDWCIPGDLNIPWIGPLTSRAQVAKFFEIHPIYLDSEEFVAERVLTDGADAVLLGRLRSRLKTNDALMKSWFVIHLTVRDGEIVRYRLYEDSLAISRAWSAP
ncbi:nuclear transport factor 2 family protein [Streptomyces sp. MST-110588]|uniref:nuclear transport factor 2 family protein n=1 Tax=Streptomyces sp. MST-110588 TaxID=2833628 RepID=UPI001F5DD04A|nr:nuclear transport factor 2 family protein [Streptomyces sp. MST-110588]UNO40429.1 nuclear transport factor 2 family protein [Streptomyces sp. MST-110588]